MIPTRGFSGRNVAVLGLGRTGLSAARALLEDGARVFAWDDSEAGRHMAQEQEGISVVDLRQDHIWTSIEMLVVSPGIPHLYPQAHPIITRAIAHGVPVDNDIGLFFRSMAAQGFAQFDTPPRVVAVTGSNGKSTTASLIHHLLHSAGRPTQLAGNIGHAVMDITPPHDGEVIVLELSSYQTELARALTPDLAVLTNISPDHLDRHGGIGGYFAAKRRLFAEGGPDRAIIGVDEPEGAFLANQLSEGAADDRVIRISADRKLDGPGWSVFVRKGFLSEYRKTRQIASIDLRAFPQLPGAHNQQNICAAYSVCRALGIAPKVIEEALKTFKALPHRSQLVTEVQGVRFINDSKATNVDAAAKALGSFQNIRWICGGLMKEATLGPISEQLGAVLKAYVIGADPQAFAQLLPCDYEICGTLERAVQRAWQDASEDDTVLLAPAAASQDQFKNFEERGERFIHLVSASTGISLSPELF